MIPAYISENNIVVASSNNGAVQNIVNELPLRKEIDEALIGELEQADYFYEISNAKLSAEWKENESGKRQEELVMEAGQGEEKFWGTFSLEGGKSDNMTNILTNIKHIHKELEEIYVPDPDIYKQFLKQYEEAEAVRAEAQAFADSIRAFQDSVQKLEQARISYRRESGEKERRCMQNFRDLEKPVRNADGGWNSCIPVWRRQKAAQRLFRRAETVWSCAFRRTWGKSPVSLREGKRRRSTGAD